MEEGKRRKEKELEAQGEKKLPYPKSVFFIVGNEFCERFSYYGMKAILSIYLSKKLHYSEDKATVIYHTFSMFCYFCPIFGALLADTLLGKFKTIVYISIFYVLGHLLKTLAAIPTLGVPPVEFSLIGLALIAVGTGGIKPCVAAFGGDQFQLPQQERQLQSFFSVFYFSINAGALISTFLTPILRQDVHCFGETTCYSLAFGIPAILMFVATLIIILGKPLYRINPPQGNILTKVVGSIGFALKNDKKGDHWLDVSKEKYGSQLVEDVKILLRLLVLYIPIPVFWALFDQTGSRWTFQATRMNGVVGGVTVKPDQMQVINPVMILFLLPLFDKVIYPLFAKFGLLKKPLQKMVVGGMLTAASFVISGFLELNMMKTYADLPSHLESHVHLMNNLPCHVSVQISNYTGFVNEVSIEGFDNLVITDLVESTYTLDMEVSPSCLPDILSIRQAEILFNTEKETVSSVLLSADGGAVIPTILSSPDEPEKDNEANGRLRVVHDLEKTLGREPILSLMGDESIVFELRSGDVGATNYTEHLPSGEYHVYLDDIDMGDVEIEQGGVYSLLVARDPTDNVNKVQTFVLTEPNSIHIFWLFPQYFVITVSEIMFSVTGLEFSYSQAPESMKSVVQAAWLMTTAVGHVIVIIVAESKLFDDQASEFFMFAALMAVDVLIFMFLAWRFVPRDQRKVKSIENEDNNNGQINTSFNADTSM